MESPSPFNASDDIAGYKLRFAEALLREPQNAFLAGKLVFGEDIGRALFAATNWIDDVEVLGAKAKLLQQKGARAFLPSKEDFAREVWNLAKDTKTPVEDKRALLSLFADTMGYKEQAKKNDGIVIERANKVMIVKDHGSDAEWEEKARKQQARLTRDDKTVIDVVATTH